MHICINSILYIFFVPLFLNNAYKYCLGIYSTTKTDFFGPVFSFLDQNPPRVFKLLTRTIDIRKQFHQSILKWRFHPGLIEHHRVGVCHIHPIPIEYNFKNATFRRPWTIATLFFLPALKSFFGAHTYTLPIFIWIWWVLFIRFFFRDKANLTILYTFILIRSKNYRY